MDELDSYRPWEGSWLLQTDKQNYGRYFSVYYTQMTWLEIYNPEMHDHFKIGGFSEQIGWSNPFGRILVDQTTEDMANKDTLSGTKGFTLNACAVSRYYMTVEYRKVCLWNLRHMVQVQTSGIVRMDLEPPGMLKNLLENSCVNPLSCMNPFELVCLFTTSAASEDVQDDLLHAQTGRRCQQVI